MLRILGVTSGGGGLFFSGACHKGRTLASNLRPHDRLVDVPRNRQRSPSANSRVEPTSTSWDLLYRSVGPDFSPGGIGWAENPADESRPFLRWRFGHANPGAHPYLLALLGCHRCDIR